jgi:hypothetical protein
MGVPAFFGWLTRKYPAILERCVEKAAANANSSDPNASATKSDGDANYASHAAQVNIQVEIKEGEVPKESDVTVEIVQHVFDNFYLDMFVLALSCSACLGFQALTHFCNPQIHTKNYFSTSVSLRKWVNSNAYRLSSLYFEFIF